MTGIKSPRVTVITAVFNGVENLENTIVSVREQSYENIEYILIDGGSVDGTVELIRKYEESLDFWLSEKDSGISDAFNKGLAHSTGDWVIFMNSGDSFIDSDSISNISNHLSQEYDLVYGHINLTTKEGKVIRKQGKHFDQALFHKWMIIPHQATFHNKTYFEKYGNYYLEFKFAMDYELLLRKKDIRINYQNIVVANMLDGGVSRTMIHGVLREYFKAKQMHQVKGRLLCFLDYIETYLRYKYSKLREF